MPDDFVHSSRKRGSVKKKKYTLKKLRASPMMMSGALPSSAEYASELLYDKRQPTASNATPPSAQRPPTSQSPSEMAPLTDMLHTDDMLPDDIDDDALLAATPPTKPTPTAERNAHTVLSSSQATVRTIATPAARPPTTKWTAEEEWTVVEGIRGGLSQAQILLNLLPTQRSASAIRGKKKELQEKWGPQMETLAGKERPKSWTPAPPVPLRKTWSPDDTKVLRKCMSEGLSDRDIQAIHFPNRTEDSVIGKLRKLRAAAIKSEGRGTKRKRGDFTTKLSQSLFASSSPVMHHGNSSQTVERSSPAQAAFTRRLEDALPVVHEEGANDQGLDDNVDVDEEAPEEYNDVEDDVLDVDIDGAENLKHDVLEVDGAEDLEPEMDNAKHDDYEMSDAEDVKVPTSDANDATAPAIDIDDVDDDDAKQQDGEDVNGEVHGDVEEDGVAVGVQQDDPVEQDNTEDGLAEEEVILDSLRSDQNASLASRRTAFVLLPERPDLSDVIDCRVHSIAHVESNRADELDQSVAAIGSSKADDLDQSVDAVESNGADAREVLCEAVTPPFRPGQEDDQEGILHATKNGLWREAYARCHGDVEAAYREYESLRTDEHMLQAVCNLDYEIINAVKAVRMRRAHEDAVREGRTPPETPIQDQPQHLDLFPEKEYGKYYSYKPWAKETEDMYLNEPIVYGARPVPGAPQVYADPMHERSYDDGDASEEGEDDQYEECNPYLAEEGQGAPVTAEEPFHGHISEIEDDGAETESRSVVMSHREAEIEAAARMKRKSQAKEAPKAKKQAAVEETNGTVASRKRMQLAAEESMPTPTSKKQSREARKLAPQDDMKSPPTKKMKTAKLPQPTQEESPPTEVLSVEEDVKIAPTLEEVQSPAHEETLASPPAQKQKKERKKKPAPEATTATPPAEEIQQLAQEETVMSLPAKKQKKATKKPSREEATAPPVEETQQSAQEETLVSPPGKKQKKDKKKPSQEEPTAPIPVKEAQQPEEKKLAAVPPSPKKAKKDKKKPSQEEIMAPTPVEETQQAKDELVTAPSSPKKQKKNETTAPIPPRETQLPEQELVTVLLSPRKQKKQQSAQSEIVPLSLIEETAAPAESMPAPPITEQKKKQKKSKKRSAPDEIMAPPTSKKARRGSKTTPVIGKNGEPMSKAAFRRRQKALRRSSASITTSEVNVEVQRAQILPDVQTIQKQAVEQMPVEKPVQKEVVKEKVVQEQVSKAVKEQPAKEKPAKDKSAKEKSNKEKVITSKAASEHLHPEDNPSQWMRDIVKNAKHKPPPIRRASPPPIDPNNLFGRGDPSDESESGSESD